MKYSFRNDYSEIAHPEVMKELVRYSDLQFEGYGEDYVSNEAKKAIKNTFNLSNSEVHFVSGGTQANMLLISYFLKNYEAVLCSDTAHINVHETAAVEGSGHKIITVKNKNGKILLSNIKKIINSHNNYHMAKIKMIYVSNSTEIGSIYKKEELKEIYSFCKDNNIYFMIDGARLASALSASENDVLPSDLCELCDMFYIGGTKAGLMYGEAIVINNKKLSNDFLYHIKNKGALLAKGFVAGIQFKRLFSDSLYFDIGKYENELALYLAQELIRIGYELYSKCVTNQVFVLIDKEKYALINNEYACEIWDEQDDLYVVRFVTSWHTKKDDISEFIKFLIQLRK